MRVAVMLVVLLLAGCGSSPSEPPAPEADPLPVPVTGPEPGLVFGGEEVEETLPELPENPSLTERVLREIRVETVASASILGETSAACDGGAVSTEPEASTRCHVIYDNVTVPWQVNVDSGGDDDLVVAYVAFPLKGLLLARAVHGIVWSTYHEDHEDLRCDDIPVISLAELGEDTGYRCQYAEQRPDGSVVRRNMEIHLSDGGGIQFRNPRS